MIPSQIANDVQTSGCATATTAITSERVYGTFLAIQKCPMDSETSILFRARNWSYFECLMIQRLLEKETSAHSLTVAYLNNGQAEDIGSCAQEDRRSELKEGHK